MPVMNIRYRSRWVRVVARAAAAAGLSAAANAATDTVTLTEGKQEFAPVIYAGLLTGVTGSVVPITLSGGKTISTLAEVSQSQSEIQVDGFKSDPGQSWLISVPALGVTNTGAKAMYNYANGKATWVWSAEYFGFLKQAPGTKIPCTIVHN
jgi:hypothetical protein